MSSVANVAGTPIPGTQVEASFPSFAGPYPELYYKAQQGTLTLASVNAGNSDTLCVGLGGVNYGFYLALTAAGQKGANLNPQPASGNNKPCSAANAAKAADDYQGRHLKLLAKAGPGGTAFETYTTTDPCRFAYVNAAQRKGAPGTEGICFIDVFDSKLCPVGDAKNAAMLYMIPPNGIDYTKKADFLAAVQATATQMIETIAGYNALAVKQSLPVIEALRNTLYSSGNYKFAGVTNDEIACAIFAGFSTALASNPNAGLLELQFPVNTGTDRLFEAVAADLTANPAPPRGGPHRVARVPRRHFPPGRRVVADNSDSEDEDTEEEEDDPDDIEMSEVDPTGAPVAKATAGGDSVSNQSQAVSADAGKDLNLLRKGQMPQNYGQLPKPRYAAANSPLVVESRGRLARAREGIYGSVTPEDMISGAPNAADSPALQAAKEAKVAVDAVRDASDRMLDAQDLKTAKGQRDLAKQQATAARQAAKTADAAAKIAEQAAGDDEDEAKAAADRNYANSADDLASRAEGTTQSMEVHYEELKRSEAARTSSKARLVGILIAIAIGAVFTTLGLLWTFLFGYGRKLFKNGAGRFFTKDLDIQAPDTVSTVDVDVLAELQNVVGESFSYIKAVHMVDGKGNTVDTISDSSGNWSAAADHITYTPPTPKLATPVSVQYVLEAEGPVAAPFTDPSKLTITFTAGPTPTPAVPTDKIKAATDRTSAVTFAVDAGFLFDNGAPTDSEGTWSYDSVKSQVSFTPNTGSTVAAPVKIATYRLDRKGTTANLVALFPAKPLGPATASRTMGFTFPDAAYDVILFDSTGQPTTKSVLQKGVGTWSALNKQIHFAPDPAISATTSSVNGATINYAFVYGTVPSVTASATLSFPAATQPPVAADISKITADRTKTLSFDLVGVIPSGSWTDPFGTWAIQNNQVTYTPSQPLAAGQVNSTVSYTLSNAAGTSNPAKLTVYYLPAPNPIPQPASRLINPVVDIGADNTAATAPYSVKLWDSSNLKAVPTLDNATGGTWSADPTAHTITFILPHGLIDPSDPMGGSGLLRFPDPQVSVYYVLVADVSAAGDPTADGSHSVPAILTFNFKMDPVAYDVSAVFPSFPSNAASIDVQKHVVANGISKVRLNGSDTSPFLEIENNVQIATWTYRPPALPNGPTIQFFQTASVSRYSVTYSVVDGGGKESNPATITLYIDPMAMPQTGPLLLAQDVTSGKAAAMDILAASSSFFDKDPKSVRLVGLQDIAGDQLPTDALIHKNGTSINVPGEGVWMVCDDGKIAFQGEAGLTDAPTPALVQFADVKGNWSNPAPIVIDEALTQIPAIGAALLKMDDATFWAAFIKNLAQPLTNQAPLTPEEFIAGTLAIAGAVRTQVEIGNNPVPRAALDTAYATWDAAGQPWDPNDDPTNNLVALATNTAGTALTGNKTPLLARFWTLDTISRMLTRGLPDT